MVNRTAKWNSVAALLVAGAVVLAGWLANPAALAQGQGKTETLTGTIGDTMCGAKSMGADSKQCAMDCVKKMNGKYALIVGEKVYTLDGKEADVEKLAGRKAKVTGIVQGTTIKVTAAAAAS